jgi:monoterpene epsilon-lactone hydrolase
VSRSQLQQITELLRTSPLDLGGDVTVMRQVFDEMLAATPVPPEVRTTPVTRGGVPAIEVVAGPDTGPGAILYFHGGGYALGSAARSVNLAADIARRTHRPVYTVDYRLAPEHPYPAAVDDADSAYRGLLDDGLPAHAIAIAGESAGGGLAVALLLRLRDQALPLPAAAAVMSPWADLTGTADSLRSRADLDASLTREALAVRAADYLAGADPRDPYASPARADLSGLPPLLVQVGTAEILLDDALHLAARAARDDVSVTLETFPAAPHVFQGFAAVLDEGSDALDRLGAFIRTHLDTPNPSATPPVAPVPSTTA